MHCGKRLFCAQVTVVFKGIAGRLLLDIDSGGLPSEQGAPRQQFVDFEVMACHW